MLASPSCPFRRVLGFKREMTDVRQTWVGEEWMMTPGHEQVVEE